MDDRGHRRFASQRGNSNCRFSGPVPRAMANVLPLFMRLATCYALAIVLGCAPVARPVSFPEQMATENYDLPLRSIESPDGSFSTEIIGRLQSPLKVMKGEAGLAALIDIGSATPVECTIFDGDLDLAAAMVEFSDRGFEKIARHFGPVVTRQTQRISANVIEGAPMFALSWRYRVGTGMGLIKHRIASVDGRGLYCRHVEVGYAKTFSRLFATMVRGFESADDDTPEAVHTVVSRTKLHNRPRGVERHVTWRLDDESFRIESRASLLVASLYGRLTAVDTVLVLFARQDGSLINAVYARSENGILRTNLSLDPQRGSWFISGVRDGIPFESKDGGGGDPVSTLGELHALRAAIRDHGTDGSVEVRGWYPHIDPLKLAQRVTVIGPRRDAEHFNVISQVGPVVIESVIDTSGETTWSRWLDPSSGELETERVFCEGEL